MQTAQNHHTFHIPVMGIGFTIDTPIKVAHLGISSVISLVDDMLIEKMRKHYSAVYGISFHDIPDRDEDHRAKRITEYLDLVDTIVQQRFAALKRSLSETGDELKNYFDLLPDLSDLKRRYREFIRHHRLADEVRAWLDAHLRPGSIDVNIMTKLDKTNYDGDRPLSSEYNDAHAALRGFARSGLRSSIVFSAGMNPRLYGYLENFDDFYPDENGDIKKKIIMKVSDYRSAIIQGKFLAKKGLWVSEYRIESGLNCGGHAFATDGYLMGPILEEFKTNRASLISQTHELLTEALKRKNRHVPPVPLPVRTTAQGGVGTAEEHDFLLERYGLDSIGWGSPFLLVPEVTNVDPYTRELLCKAKEDDLYLSNISPLGVPFNSLRGNTKDIEKQGYIDKGRPGSPCPRKYVQLNTEFGDRAICIASREYQYLKLKQLEESDPSPEDRQKRYDAITEKSCICVGLGTPALLVNDLDTKTEGPGVSVCPGPNIAYFSRTVTLKEMIDHIYGKIAPLTESRRPHMFVKELQLYVDYLKEKLADASKPLSEAQAKYFSAFHQNLRNGIDYYSSLFEDFGHMLSVATGNIMDELDAIGQELYERATVTG